VTNEQQTQVIIANGALHMLLMMLSNEKNGIKKEACWTISNILTSAGGNRHEISG
jgi:importin subunit alpha-1